MAFPSSKCVLLLTDDTLCIYEAGAKGVVLAESFGWRIPDFETLVANALNRIAGDGLVYILNDGVEQHYRKEKSIRLRFLSAIALSGGVLISHFRIIPFARPIL